MNTLWAFGDSFTAGLGVTDDKHQYGTYKGKEHLIWSRLLADHLGMKHQNHGVHGISNDMIWDNILHRYKDIQRNDVVVIGLTKCARFGVYQPDHWQAGLFGVAPIRDSQLLLGKQVADAILKNIRKHIDKVYLRNQANFDFLCTAFQRRRVKAYYWDELLWRKFTTITKESKHADHHWGIKGHKQMFEYLKKEMEL